MRQCINSGKLDKTDKNEQEAVEDETPNKIY